MPDEAVSAPAPAEVEKLHDEFLGAVTKWQVPETLQAEFKPIAELKTKYEAARTKYQGDLKAYTEAEAKKNVVPEKYEFAIADDSPLGKDYGKTMEALAKDKKMTQARATELLQDRDQTVRGFVAQRTKDFQASIEANAQKLKAHPVMGGANLEKTELLCTQVINKFGNEKVMDTLKKAGAFTDPDIVELIYKIGMAIGPERMVVPTQQTKEAAIKAGVDKPPAGFSEVRTAAGVAK